MLSSELRDKLIALSAIAVIVWGAALAAYSQPPPPRPAVSPQQEQPQATPATEQPDNNQRGTFEFPLVVETHEGAPSAEIAAQQAEDREQQATNERWVVRSTIVIAAFTVVLAIATFALVWRACRQEHHFKVTERAYIKLSHVTPKMKPDGTPRPALEIFGDRTMFLRIEVKNHGRTPGTVRRVLLTYAVRKDRSDPPRRDYDAPQARTFAAGAFLVTNDGYTIPHSFPAMTEEETVQVELGNWTLWIFGYVEYSDQFGNTYRGGYGRMYTAVRGGNNLGFHTSDLNYDEEQPQQG